MPRFLGLDIGEARTGVAVSDDTGRMALPVETVPRTRSVRKDAGLCAQMAVDRDVKAIVVGLPQMMNGEQSEQASRIEAFVRVLRGYVRIPIHLQDERLTTYEAAEVLREAGSRRKARKERLDAVAACIILQAWLNERALSERATPVRAE